MATKKVVNMEYLKSKRDQFKKEIEKINKELSKVEKSRLKTIKELQIKYKKIIDEYYKIIDCEDSANEVKVNITLPITVFIEIDENESVRKEIDTEIAVDNVMDFIDKERRQIINRPIVLSKEASLQAKFRKILIRLKKIADKNNISVNELLGA